jgi:hypothetical protein
MKNSDEQKRIGKAKTPRTKRVQNHKVAEEAIRQRAFEIYLARRGEPGRELDDWLQAERELTTSKS